MEHEPIEKYFKVVNGGRERYSEMKVAHAAIDALIKDGTLVGQLTLDEDMVVFKADTKIKEPIDLTP
jgi:hypothetical protein